MTLVRYEDIVSKDKDTLTSIEKIGRLSLEEMNYVINKKVIQQNQLPLMMRIRLLHCAVR